MQVSFAAVNSLNINFGISYFSFHFGKLGLLTKQLTLSTTYKFKKKKKLRGQLPPFIPTWLRH